MTITSTISKVSYSGNGSTTVFAITFVYYDDTDIRVILRTDSSGAESVFTDGTEYTISGGSGATGTLTIETTPTDFTPASGTTLIIKSNRSNTQGVDLPVGGDIPSDQLEQGLDKIVRLVQQESEELDRAVQLSETSPTTNLVFPEPAATGNIIGWNAAGTNLANIEVGDVTAFNDILFTGKATGDMIRFNGTNWVNRTATETLSDLSAAGTGLANTFSAAQIFSSTTKHTGTQTLTKGADLASAATVTLGTDGNYFDVTGTTTITAINGIAGTPFTFQFDGILTFTDGASLTLPGNANITTAAGDTCRGFMLSTTAAIITSYTKTSGAAVIVAADADTLEIRHEANTTNATKTNVKLQSGWGFIDGAGATRVSESVTFPTAFTTELLSIQISFTGMKVGSDPSTILDYGTTTDNVIEVRALTSSISVFTAEFHSDAVMTSGTRFGYSWLATGI